MRKLTAYITLTAFLWLSVITPAKAFLPAIAAWAATLTTAEQVALGSSIALHTAIAAIKFTSDNSAPASDGGNVTLQVQIDPNTPLVLPDSATATAPATVAATQQANTPYTSTKSYNIGYSCNQNYPTISGTTASAVCSGIEPQRQDAIARCNYAVVTLTGPTEPNKCNYSNGGQYTLTQACPDGGTVDGSGTCNGGTKVSCPSGYTRSGTTLTCNLTNPSVAQVSDNKKNVSRSGNTFVQDSNDPDTLPSNVTVTSNKVKVDNGNKHDEVVIETNGTVSYYHWEGQTDGTTKQQKTSISAPSGGAAGTTQVTGTDTSSFAGSGDNTGGSGGTGATSSNVNVTGGTVQATLDKSGLATDGKQCGYDAAHPCKVEVDTTGLGTNAISQDDYSTKSAAHLAKLEEVGQGGDHGFTWDWNPLSSLNTGACSDPTFMIGGKNYIDLTGFCDKVAYLRGFFEFMLYITTGIALFNILTGRREET